MTGAGFGGCAIAIVEEPVLEHFIQNVGERYKQTIGYEASFYTVRIGKQAGEISLEAFIDF
jgi:galactokinase